ncbi:hypothetical protein OS493_038577 [Desmophyllum pertusum]|uniref:Uncharacterized protein n=1 Tax=Desmophyllum pertusum TaxID=174260 RepID=A0A9W9Z648_9CNID|nr:hypothetical protein OS493_038577 [Desmophyllum pertusum]
MPFSALYVKLVKGKQLPGATVVTTCRPNVVQSVAGLKFDRKVEIMGFTTRESSGDYLMGNVGFSYRIEETLYQAGSLAKTGIEEMRHLFDSTEVKGMENCGLFNCMPDIKVSPFRLKSHFCFIHLTLQELLAAREIAKMEPSDLGNFITSNASDPKWHSGDPVCCRPALWQGK